MAKKSHPYIDAIKISSLIFGVLILVIFYLAEFVTITVDINKTVDPVRTEQNITPPGRLYPSQ